MGMNLPDQCCVCVPLPKGGKIIAFTSIVLSLISVISVLIYLFSDFDSIAKEIADENVEMIDVLKDNRTSAQVTASFVLGLSALALVTSLMMLNGIENKDQKKLVPYLVTVGLTILFLIVISIIQLDGGNIFAVLTLVVAFIYIFICIYALYKQFENA